MFKIKINTAHTILIITLLLLLSLLAEYNQPLFFTTDDNTNFFLPNLVYNARSLFQHQTLPQVNFHQFLGQPHLDRGLNGILYPPSYLSYLIAKYLFGNELLSIEVLAVIHLIIGAIATRLLLRELKATQTLSTLGSLFWILTPYIISVSQAQVSKLQFIVALPLSFLMIEKMKKGPNKTHVLGLTITKTLLFYGGYFQNIVILSILEVIYLTPTLIKRIINKKRRSTLKLATYYLLANILVAISIPPLLLPMFYAHKVSDRRSGPVAISEFMQYAMPLKTFIQAQLFKFHRAISAASSHMYHIGIPTLLLTAMLLKKKILTSLWKKDQIWYFALATITLAATTPLYRHAYSIPIINYFRGPFKYFLPFTFFLTITVILISNELIKSKSAFTKKIVYGLLLITLLTNLLINWNHRNDTFGPWKLHIPPQNKTHEHIDKNQGRVLTYNIGNIWTTHTDQFVTANLATLFDLYHIGGYDPLISRHNRGLTMYLNEISNYNKALTPKVIEHLNTWSVRYIITKSTEKNKSYLGKIPQLKKISTDQDVALYENLTARPYAYLANDPHPLPIAFHVNSVEIKLPSKQPDTLIVSLAPLKQYSYYIDGKIIKDIPNTVSTIKIPVQTDSKIVTIKYDDKTLRYGIFFTALAWLIVMTAWATHQIKKKPLAPLSR